jgi:hypothetical protein
MPKRRGVPQCRLPSHGVAITVRSLLLCLWFPFLGATFTVAAPNLESFFQPPAQFAGDFGQYLSPRKFNDGQPVENPGDWPRRRRELLDHWHKMMGPWPPLLARPACTVLATEEKEGITLQRVRLEIAAGRHEEGWLLLPSGRGPFPAVVVPFYEPETSIGRQGKLRDFGWQLAKRGFVTLSIGSPGGDARRPDPGAPGSTNALWQPLSFLAYVAANAHTLLTQRPEVDPRRIGIVGHSYGGKWALFAGALHDKFACIVVSDPGIVWDEARPNVNYWEPWYLGRDPERSRRPGLITTSQPRTGAYRALVEQGRDLTDLHALIAPRPLLVSGGAEDPPERWRALNHLVAINQWLGFTQRVAMTNRPSHEPTPESNEQVYAFFQRFLQPP